MTVTSEAFLVIVDTTTIREGAYLTKDTVLLWVTAPHKQSAAKIAARHVKNNSPIPLANVAVRRVLARSQWGSGYFDTIREQDEAELEQ